MKTTAQLKEQIYDDLLSSGQFSGLQAQLKAYVFDLIEKEYNGGKNKTGFQYEHPQLSKLKKFPLTSYCLDLIQEFLESFKFKHTLNVFKKEINRSVAINRTHLAQSFKIQIKNPDSQSVLLSMVQQMVTGDIGAMKSEVKVNNFVDSTRTTADRSNNFMSDANKPNEKRNEPPPKAPEPSFKKPPVNNSTSNINTSNISNSNADNSLNSASASASVPKNDSNLSSSINIDSSKDEPPKPEEPKQEEKKKGGKDAKKKPVVQKEKPPEGAKDLLGDVMKKFEPAIKKNKEQEKNAIWQAKRAFSEEKEKKVVDPSESGANKIRGISMGKAVPSFMNKFMAQQPPKNESYIDEELDEFQQSKDSTRRNPLFSSTQSGFDKSGFDHSVDSNAIEDYQYVERAKKMPKKA